MYHVEFTAHIINWEPITEFSVLVPDHFIQNGKFVSDEILHKYLLYEPNIISCTHYDEEAPSKIHMTFLIASENKN